jgi:hypothetical protein
MTQAEIDTLLEHSPEAQRRRWSGRGSGGAVNLAIAQRLSSNSNDAASTGSARRDVAISPAPSAIAQVNQDLAAARLQAKVDKHLTTKTRKYLAARAPTRGPRSTKPARRSARRHGGRFGPGRYRDTPTGPLFIYPRKKPR